MKTNVTRTFALFFYCAISPIVALSSGKSLIPPKIPLRSTLDIPASTNFVSNTPRFTNPHANSPNDLNWVLVDSAPNAYTAASNEINPFAYDPCSKALAFIYRGALNYNPPNPTTGSLWYSVSTNHGMSWGRMGKLNADVDQYGRYPSCTISNPNCSPNPIDAILVYSFINLSGGVGFGGLGYGIDPFGQGTPFTTLHTGADDYSSWTFIWSSYRNNPSVYFLTERLGPPFLLEFWKSTNQGETWQDTTIGGAEYWTSQWSAKGRKKDDTLYVMALVTTTNTGDVWVFALNKSTNNGISWSGWEIINWRSIPLFSNYDNLGTRDGRLVFDFIVDAIGNEHIFFTAEDINAAYPERLKIVEVFRTPNGWSGNFLASRTTTFKPGFGALSQMDNELQTTQSLDGNAFVVKWVDAPTQGDSAGDIFIRAKRFDGVWNPILNLTQTESREMFTHTTPLMSFTNDTATIFLSKTEPLVQVPDSLIDDTQPAGLWTARYKWVITTTNVREREPSLPSAFQLYPNYPNPFNPTTTIAYDIPEASSVSLKVFDINGREVKTIFYGFQEAGKYEVTFDASSLASGVYVYKLEAGKFSASGRMVLNK